MSKPKPKPAPVQAPAPILTGRCCVCTGTIERRGGQRVGGTCRCAAVKGKSA